MTDKKPTPRQIDKFREAAREIETDDSEEAFDQIVRKIAKTPPNREGKEKGREKDK